MKNYLKSIIFLIRDFERPIKELFNQTNGLTSELFFRVLAKAAKLLESNEPNLEIEKCYLFILHLLNTIILNNEDIVDDIFYYGEIILIIVEKLKDLISIGTNQLIYDNPDECVILGALITEILEIIDHTGEDPERRKILLTDGEYLSILNSLFERQLFFSNQKIWKASCASVGLLTNVLPQIKIDVLSEIIEQLKNELSNSRITNLHSLITLKGIMSNKGDSEDEFRDRVCFVEAKFPELFEVLMREDLERYADEAEKYGIYYQETVSEIISYLINYGMLDYQSKIDNLY